MCQEKSDKLCDDIRYAIEKIMKTWRFVLISYFSASEYEATVPVRLWLLSHLYTGESYEHQQAQTFPASSSSSVSSPLALPTHFPLFISFIPTRLRDRVFVEMGCPSVEEDTRPSTGFGLC